MDANTQDKLFEIADYVAMGYPEEISDDFLDFDGLFVFCREDPLLADATASLLSAHNDTWLLLTGGIGKGSGEGSKRHGSEAAYQLHLLYNVHTAVPAQIFLETKATNGAENSRFGIRVLQAYPNYIEHKKIVLLVHPRNARRVYAVHTLISREESFAAKYQVHCMHAPFNPLDPFQRHEVISEFLRTADWPAKGWSDPQPDLPQDLVDWARTYNPA